MSTSAKAKGKRRATRPEPTAALPLGKQLAHTDKIVRDHAIESLSLFLSHGGKVSEQGSDVTLDGNKTGGASLSEADMRKLWKGLFYCFWMSDKPLVQQRLAADLAQLVLVIQSSGTASSSEEASTKAALDFVAGFWEAMVREWAGIDRLRIDKFYLLIRRFVRATFRLLSRAKWEPSVVSRLNEILSAEQGPLSTTNIRVPPSLGYHLADVWLNELEGALEDESTSNSRVPLATTLDPFINLLACTSNSITYTRLVNAVFDPLMQTLATESQAAQPSKKRRRTEDAELSSDSPYPSISSRACDSTTDQRQGKSVVHKSVCGAMLARASRPDDSSVKDVNRRKIYQYVRAQDVDEDDDQ